MTGIITVEVHQVEVGESVVHRFGVVAATKKTEEVFSIKDNNSKVAATRD